MTSLPSTVCVLTYRLIKKGLRKVWYSSDGEVANVSAALLIDHESYSTYDYAFFNITTIVHDVKIYLFVLLPHIPGCTLQLCAYACQKTCHIFISRIPNSISFFLASFITLFLTHPALGGVHQNAIQQNVVLDLKILLLTFHHIKLSSYGSAKMEWRLTSLSLSVLPLCG